MSEITEETRQRTLILERDDIRVEAAHSISQLDDIADNWNELAVSWPSNNPMLSYAWVSSFLEHRLTGSEQWVVFLAFSAGELVGVAPVVIHPRSVIRLGLRRLHAPFDDHTPSVDVLTKCDNEKKILSALMDATGLHCGMNFTYVLNRIPEQSPTISGAFDGIETIRTYTDYNGAGAYISITGTFDDFFKGLSSNFSKNLKKSSKKLKKLTGVGYRFITHDDSSGECLNTFVKMEASGWKGRDGGAIALSPSLLSFYKALTERLNHAGWLEWHFLDAEGKAIAGHMAMRIGRTLVINKISYDEDYSNVSPGNMLFLETVSRCYQNGDIDEINCLTDMPWNRNWRMSLQKYYNMHLFANRLIPILTGELPCRLRHILPTLPVIGPLLKGLKALVKEKQHV